MVEDLHADDPPRLRRFTRSSGHFRSLLCVPVGASGHLLALARDPGAFDEADREALAELGGYVAAAMERLAGDAGGEDVTDGDRMTEVADVLSHDVENSLAVAEGHLQLARDGRDGDHLDRVDDAHDRIRELVDDVVALARTGDRVGEFASVDLPDAVDRAWADVRTGSARLRVEDAPTVRAHGSSLRALLENLFRNAVEHGSTSPPSRTGEDAVEHGNPAVTVRVGSLDDGIYVADDGQGIPRALREQVFASGHTSSADGTGFGLSIVRRIADLHGWDVSVTAAESGGARFEIRGVEVESRAAPA